MDSIQTPRASFPGLAQVMRFVDLVERPIQEAEDLARWQRELDAYASDPDLPVPLTPVIVTPPMRRPR